MLLPQRLRFTCPECNRVSKARGSKKINIGVLRTTDSGRTLIINRVVRVIVTCTDEDGVWIVLCPNGHQLRFTGDAIIWISEQAEPRGAISFAESAIQVA